jgi:hypothetical protein
MATRIQKNCGVSRRLRGLLRLVDDEVAIVEGLDAEEVELEVGGRVEGGAELGEIVVEEAGVEALDGDAVLEVFLEGALVGSFSLPMPSRMMSQPRTSS